MPPIESVTIGADSVTIVTSTRGTIVLTRAQIPGATLLQPIATIETFVNNFLATRIDAFQIVVHIFQVNPTLSWTYLCLDLGEPIPSQWWLGA